MLDHRWIAEHIPHQGSMCLLESVVDWSATTISCRATSHTDPANPLRAEGRLGAASGIEYAAQAMAVHGALCAAAGSPLPPRRGMLTSVRGVALHVPRLDDVAADLVVQAERVSGDGGAAAYAFSLRAGELVLVEGRATVILDIAALEGQG